MVRLYGFILRAVYLASGGYAAVTANTANVENVCFEYACRATVDGEVPRAVPCMTSAMPQTCTHALTGDLVLALPVDACPANPPAQDAYAGKLLLAKRGGCPFTDKLTHAAAGGATGVVVYNHQEGELPAAPHVPAPATLLLTLIEMQSGAHLRQALEAGKAAHFALEAAEGHSAEEKSLKSILSAINQSLVPSANPHLRLLPDWWMEWLQVLVQGQYLGNAAPQEEVLSVLDVGGGNPPGASTGCQPLLRTGQRMDLHVLDLELSRAKLDGVTIHQGDITAANLGLAGTDGKQFDVVYTKDTFEHILNPWDATANVLKLLKPGGLFIFQAPFSWRYHAYPVDAYRYSHTGAQYLFERLGGMRRVVSGYYYGKNWHGWKSKLDMPMDGDPFPKSIEVVYVGMRTDSKKFAAGSFDPRARLDGNWDYST
jgi:SAM-dependent methyltransferase